MNRDQALIRLCQESGQAVAVTTSPLAEKLSARVVSVDAASQSVTMDFYPDEFFTQAMNVLQGGAIATMLDYALAFAVMAKLPDGYSVATISLNTAFIKPVQPGRLVAESTVDHVGRTCAFARSTLARADGTIVATASAPLTVLPPRE